MTVLQERYQNEIMPELVKRRGYGNRMEVPALKKVVISVGVGTARDKDVFDEARRTIETITGQKTVTTRARLSIANFKLREGMPVGVIVTLRGQRMYDFIYRLVNIALPLVRDFRGVSRRAFDGRGNYTLGLNDQSIFTEINLDKMKHTIGMNITIVTSARTNEEALELLTLLGMPFAAANEENE